MPTYTVTDPNTGKTVKLTGDSPPTETELNHIFTQIPKDTNPGLLQRGMSATGSFLRNYGPQTAGAIALGSAVASAPFTAGLSIPAAAALTAGATGLGAAGGEAYRQLGERAFGGKPPQTSMEAAANIGEQGAVAAATDLGFSGLTAFTKMFLPTFSQVFNKVPAQALKRGMNKPEIIPGTGDAARTQVERLGIDAVRKVQESLDATRTQSGKAVRDALEGMQTITKGAKVFDFSSAAATGRELLDDIASGDPTVKEAIGGDLSKIKKILKSMEDSPMVDAKTAVSRVRALDDLVSYNKSGVRPIESNTAGRIIKMINHEIRSSIDNVSDQYGYQTLKEANANHSVVMDAIDEMGGLFRSRTTSAQQTLPIFKKIAGKFAQGGMQQELLQDVANKFPQAAKPMNDLLDQSAAYWLSRMPMGTPSGTIKDLARMFLVPSIPQAIKYGSKIPGRQMAQAAALSNAPTSTP